MTIRIKTRTCKKCKKQSKIYTDQKKAQCPYCKGVIDMDYEPKGGKK